MRVVIADDSMLVREGVARLLTDAGMDVVGTASAPAEPIQRVDDLRPDVAVIDIRMPPTHTDEGIVAAQQLRASHPGIGLLLLSQYLDSAYAARLLEDVPQSAGYLLKDRVSDIAVLADAIHRVADGAACAALADGEVTAELGVLGDELRTARDELDQLAQGIHPRLLVDGGLALALPGLAASAGLAVQLDVRVGRLPVPVEAALYYVCSEAITNAAKYAESPSVSVSVTCPDDDVVAEITDEGISGADPDRGSGLCGLADRVATLGGELTIDSPRGGGTRLKATIPIGRSMSLDGVGRPVPETR